MKKLLLIPALMVGTLSMATDYNYEVTPIVAHNISEGNIDIHDQTLVGIEAQYNGLNSILSPELSVVYGNDNYVNSFQSTNIYRIALNGVYEYEKMDFFTPIAKAGVGYETLSTHLFGNEDSPFLDAAVGAKVPLAGNLALKLEAVYMLKNNDNRWDNNLALLAGLNFAFGDKVKSALAVARTPQEESVVVPAASVVPVDGDNDNDGVRNSIDRCLNSAEGENVDNYGCKIDGDDDNDGVKNSIDECPSSPAGATVNAEGCPVIVDLHINFENDSAVIKNNSFVNVDKFANFLKMYPAYNAKVTGYTDNKGNMKYNQKLSERRADAVKVLLVKKGINAQRISTQGKGATNFITGNKTEAERAQNRRIEAELTKN